MEPESEYMFAQLITGVIVFMICACYVGTTWAGTCAGAVCHIRHHQVQDHQCPVKEMAYLFMVVGISAVNALLPINNCLQWILFANIILVMITFIMEKVFFSKNLSHRTITYNNTDLLKPSKHPLLLQELKELTELNIVRFEIGKVDYVKKYAQIRIFYSGESNKSFHEGRMEMMTTDKRP